MRGYNKDHIESPIEYMGNKLPMPYSLTEIDRITWNLLVIKNDWLEKYKMELKIL
mgnify:CR=1 FL=1